MFLLNLKNNNVKWLIRIVVFFITLICPVVIKFSDPDVYQHNPIWWAIVIGLIYGFVLNFGLFATTFDLSFKFRKTVITSVVLALMCNPILFMLPSMLFDKINSWLFLYLLPIIVFSFIFLLLISFLKIKKL